MTIRVLLAACVAALLLTACGGGRDADATAEATGARSERPQAIVPAEPKMTRFDAVRLANQATFGPTEALVEELMATGPAPWIAAQMALQTSRYSRGGGAEIHRNTTSEPFCSRPMPAGETDDCWRDLYSADPLVWDFYRNAVGQPDQLRQRVAFALQQILVVSNVKVYGTYGLRRYHNMLLSRSFANYRDVLEGVVRSPVMGIYLDNVNNDPEQPNENLARELLQLFSIGTCQLNPDGTQAGPRCRPTYDNRTVREYAYALTGWTFPPGGTSADGICWPPGSNCTFLDGAMVSAPQLRNFGERTLLSGVKVPAGANAPTALEHVLDSVMAHPNIGPFIGKQLIQHLVTSNPRPAYVQRVALAFDAGRFVHDGVTFGTGRRGDLSATVAAILLDPQARGPVRDPASAGKLREPALLFTGVLRALNGRTDGEDLGNWWGRLMRQYVFYSPSVFNFYPPDYPVASTDLLGPQFAIHNADTALARMNFLTQMIEWGGTERDPTIPGSFGSLLDLSPFMVDVDQPSQLVRRMSLLALGRPLPAAQHEAIVRAVWAWNPTNVDDGSWREGRVIAAAMLVFASPEYQIIR